MQVNCFQAQLILEVVSKLEIFVVDDAFALFFPFARLSQVLTVLSYLLFWLKKN